jgi:hypothetical protein
MTSRSLASAAAAFLILAAGSALAQQSPGAAPPPAKAMRQACTADVKTFCSDITPGQGRLMQCMKDHADKLSAGCTAAVAQARAARKAAHQAAESTQPAPQ